MVGLIAHWGMWHYSRALGDMYAIWTNFVWFFFHFFSIGLLARTIGAPFKRIETGYRGEKALDLENFFEALAANTIMRIVGAFLRLFLILIGMCAIILATLLYLFLLCVWLVAPVLLVGLISAGITFIAL